MEKEKSFYEKKGVITTIKLILIGALILLLLIPNFFISELIKERKVRQSNVTDEISKTFSGSQYLIGPILKIPFEEKVFILNEKGDKTGEIVEKINYAYFLPQELNIKGDVKTHMLYRGIYETVVYSSDLHFSGFFSKDLVNKWIEQQSNKQILWNFIEIFIAFSDQKGIQNNPIISWNKENINFDQLNTIPTVLSNNDYNYDYGYDSENNFYFISLPQQGIQSYINYDTKIDNTFSFNLALKGSNYLMFSPLGETTNVSLNSNWHSPSFIGNFLPNPETKQISNTGFKSDWQVLHFNRLIPKLFFQDNSIDFKKSHFGVEFEIEADHYQKTQRSIKYMILIITLTFLIFFITEIIKNLRIHIFQYILIGLAISIFFILLLALSEIIGFDKAYISAAIVTILLISIYSLAIFRNRNSTLLLLVLLILLYVFIFIIIQLVEYSLLVGASGLFIILALIMYATRKIKFYDQ